MKLGRWRISSGHSEQTYGKWNWIEALCVHDELWHFGIIELRAELSGIDNLKPIILMCDSLVRQWLLIDALEIMSLWTTVL